MLKSALVVSSLVFCAGAVLASPPSPEAVAEWKGAAMRSADSLGRSAVSIALRALPSADDVARYAESARLRAKSFAATSLGNFHEPEPPGPPEAPPRVAAPQGRPSEPEKLTQDRETAARPWISLEDIECPPESTLPRPLCDPRVQAVLQLLEEDRLRHGGSAQSFSGMGLPALPAICE
jgi:hypothetical protein